MKRTFSFILSVLMIVSCVLTLYAEAIDAEGEGLYLLMESERSEDQLTLKVYMYNNPGLSTARFWVHHNPDAVTPVSYKNGDIWKDGDYVNKNLVNLDPANSYFTVYTGPTASLNTNEGLYFTAVYDIKDDEADAGIYIRIGNREFMADDENHESIEYMPQVINRVENSHSWVFDRVIKEAGFEESGEEAYVCEICGREKTVEIPPMPAWKKGDLNNSGDINTKDAFLMKKCMTGYVPDEYEKWFCDAADVNGDGSINEMDMNLLHRIIMGGID